jgi:starch synthase
VIPRPPEAGTGAGAGGGGLVDRAGRPVTVVHLAVEYYPFARTGGLAEAANGLARYTAQAGVDTCAVMPLFRVARERAGALEEVGEPFAVDVGPRRESARLYRQEGAGETPPVWFIRHDGFFDRAGIYGERGADYPDNEERWAFFGLAALAALPRMAREPILLHAHDWHTALALVHLRVRYGGDPRYDAIRTVLSVHNAGYQGHYRRDLLDRVGLPPALYHWRQLEWYDQVNLLKGGLVYADAAVTVSPNHAAELRTAAGGFGLHDVFAWMGPRFTGILNGIDQSVWDPARDPYVITRFDASDPGPKEASKRAVQRLFGLEERPDAPLFVMTARLVTQKGLDIMLDGSDLLTLPAQFAFLGAGEPRFERALAELARTFPGRIAVDTRFRDEAEHLLMAGGDFLLMPCQYEPCGLTQMRAQRYGTLPVVRRVGGLADTVTDGETGFVFEPYHAEPLVGAALRALDAWADPEEHLRLMRAAMARDFSWERSVERYLDLYRRVLTGEFTAPRL